MPISPSPNAPREAGGVPFSRRGMLQAGLLPLLALRGAAGQRFLDGGSDTALALQLEGGETGFHGMAISPDGFTAYFTFNAPDIVLVVDLRAGLVRSGIDLTPAGPMVQSNEAVLSVDGRFLFVVNSGSGNIAVIDTASERLVKVLPFCPSNSDCIKVSPAGRVYIGLVDGRLITVSCTDLSYTTKNLTVGFSCIAPSAQRASLLYAVSGEDYHLGQEIGRTIFHAFNLDTGREERRTTLQKGAACGPSGGVTRLALARSGDVAYLGWHENDAGNLTPSI